MVTLVAISPVTPLHCGPMMACTPTSSTRCRAARTPVALSLLSLHPTKASGRRRAPSFPGTAGRPGPNCRKSSTASRIAFSQASPVDMSWPVVGRTEPKRNASSFCQSPKTVAQSSDSSAAQVPMLSPGTRLQMWKSPSADRHSALLEQPYEVLHAGDAAAASTASAHAAKRDTLFSLFMVSP